MLSDSHHAEHKRMLLHPSKPIPWWKRVIDIACCIMAFPFFAIATLLVSIITLLTSPGPLFFRQERVGYMGRRFTLYKFRTMHVGADITKHKSHFADLVREKRPMLKLDAAKDARLIPGGWLLRASGLDELPQLINIFRGDMSIVGPRPCIPYEYEQYSAWQRARFNAVPGLTGLWQVSGKNRTTFEEMVTLDIRYSQVKSFWLDLKIIAKTVPALCIQVLDTHSLRRGVPVAAVQRDTTTPRNTAPTFQT